MKRGCTIISSKAKHAVETQKLNFCQQIQGSVMGRKTSADCCLGLSRAYCGTLHRMKTDGDLQSDIMMYCAMQQSWQFSTNITDDSHKMSFSCVTTPIHIWLPTYDTLAQLRFEVLLDPAYSPDLAPSGFHLFGSMKTVLRGCQFANDDKVKEVVHS
jgi:hypothetical protein